VRSLAIGAVACILKSLLVQAGAPRSLYLVSSDVEGGPGRVEHNRFRCRLLTIESRSPDTLHGYFVQFGYEMIEQVSIYGYVYRHTWCTAVAAVANMRRSVEAHTREWSRG
jgi:hypothetical protein